MLKNNFASGLTWDEAQKTCPPGVVPACHNAEKTVTISGPVDDVNKFVAELQAKGTFAREVKTAGVAFHSHFMKAIAPELKKKLEKVSIISLHLSNELKQEDICQKEESIFFGEEMLQFIIFDLQE